MTTQIKTFEGACKALKLDPTKVLPDVSIYPAQDQMALIATAKLFIIASALNGNWIPDWNNYNEYKYFPWFNMEKTSSNPSGFSLSDVVYYYTYSSVGSRLCFKSRELAKYAGEQFIDLYKDLMVR